MIGLVLCDGKPKYFLTHINIAPKQSISVINNANSQQIYDLALIMVSPLPVFILSVTEIIVQNF